jgi:hypothetical protein
MGVNIKNSVLIHKVSVKVPAEPARDLGMVTGVDIVKGDLERLDFIPS